MKQIHIARMNDVVTFETVSVDPTEQVFFTNEDPQQAHWPSMATNQLGPAPSPNSSQCALPQNSAPFTFTYTCNLHANESGTINVFAPLAPGTTTLPQAKINVAISAQTVVEGGLSPYLISGELFQITNNYGTVIQQGSGSIGPNLGLTASTNNQGITVSGTPTLVGTYNFTFTVNDGAQRNLQQVQYSMIVTA